MEIFGEFLVNQNSGDTFPLQHSRDNWICRGVPDPLAEADGRLLLAHPSISKMHAKLFLKQDTSEWILQDMSRHGIIVNDKKVVKEARLHHGDKIRVGPYVLMFYEKFKADDETAEQPLPTFYETMPRQKNIIYVMLFLIIELILLLLSYKVLFMASVSMIFLCVLFLFKQTWRQAIRCSFKVIFLGFLLGIFGLISSLARHWDWF